MRRGGTDDIGHLVIETNKIAEAIASPVTYRCNPKYTGKFYEACMKTQIPTVRRPSQNLTGTVLGYLAGASVLGGLIGIGMTDRGAELVASSAHTLRTAAGPIRTREPQTGDYWAGCNAARAAGTAPIYIGEPGYREGMDGDGDGIACEPYRGG